MKYLKAFLPICICLLAVVPISAFCQYESIKPQGIYSSTFIIDEKQREITYYMPLRWGKEETYPLLIVLPDDKTNANDMIKKYGDLIHAKADSENCVVLYPDAYQGHWNDKKDSGMKDSVNDVGFVTIMLEFFVRQFNCDESRVYLLGSGSGGNLSHRFNCESTYQPAVVATINAGADRNSFSNCRHQTITPSINLQSNSISNADITKSLQFLFAPHE